MNRCIETAMSLTLLVTCCIFCTITVEHASAMRSPSLFDGRESKINIDKKHHNRHKLPAPHSYGYLDVAKELGSSMYYMYYEPREPIGDLSTTPIVVWLQGGPGCSSLFGMLYINGPYWVNDDDLSLRDNPGSWNRLYGLLYIEQPISTGFSMAGKQALPNKEEGVAADLYAALNDFYARNSPHFDSRPLIIAGESYAGKYVPSISHYVLQAEALHGGFLDKLRHPRNIYPAGHPERGATKDSIPAPRFKFGGMAIGNGWTDADTQQLVQGEVAWSLGLIDAEQRRIVDSMSYDAVQLLKSKKWTKARELSDEVNNFISNVSGTATLEDVRRNIGYDGVLLSDQYLNQPHFIESMGVRRLENGSLPYWISCSPEVDRVLGPDVMKTVKRLVADVLAFYPVLLYQGQYDAECGVASNTAWIQSMAWSGHEGFSKAPRDLWRVNGRVMSYVKQYDHLMQMVIRNTGHMVPHDNPYYGQLLIERWIEEQVRGVKYERETSEEEEQMYLRIRGSDEGQSADP